MTLGILLTVNALITGIYGIAFLLAPAELVAMFGVNLTGGAVVIGRLFGGALLTFGIVCWQSRGATSAEALHALALAFFVGNTLGFIITVHSQITGLVNALGWTTVALYGGLGAAFARFAFVKSEAPAAAH